MKASYLTRLFGVCAMSAVVIACGSSKSANKAGPAPSGATVGGTEKTAADAMSSGDKIGSDITVEITLATNDGADWSDGTACDSSDDGVGFCSDDTHIVFCSGGSWYELDCGSMDTGDECEQDSTTVDCYSQG